MSKLQALRERRKELATAVRQQADKMNAEGYTPTGEDEANWKKVNDDYNSALAAVEREETAARIDTDNAKLADRLPPVGGDVRAKGGDGASLAATDEVRSMALQAWCRAQMGHDLTDEHEAACKASRIRPWAKELRFNTLATNHLRDLQASVRRGHQMDASDNATKFLATLNNQVPASGGYLIPPMSLIGRLEVNMLAYGGLLQVAETIVTDGVERMGWPTADDTSNKGVRLGPNSQAAPAAGGVNQGTDPTFGQVYWDAYKYSSKAVLVPYELLMGSAFNIPTLLGGMLGERLGRVANDECTTGTGNSMPKGIVIAAGPGKTTDKAGKIGADDLMKLEHKLDPAYRGRSGVGYMMHDDILLEVRLLKDGTGQYLYKSGANFGTPDTINGRRIAINQSMSNTLTTGSVAMLYGDLASYKVRRVNGIRMYRLEERYRDNDQDGFIALLMLDGNLLTAGTNPVQKLVIQ